MFSTLYAQATEAAPEAAASSGNPLTGILPMVVIFAIFYFILIRPHSKRQKDLDKKRNTLKKGDKIVTGGGILATVSQIKEKENIVVVEISKDQKVELLKSTISNVLPST